MNRIAKILALATAMTVLSSSAFAEEAAVKTVALKPADAKIGWVGKKVTGQHNGTVTLKSGEIQVAGEALKGGKIEIDMTSIVVEDLKDADSNAKLTGHLKSDDFFGVDKFPTAALAIKSAKPVDGKPGTHEVTADLTIKDKTHPVTFPMEVSVKEGTAKVSGKLLLDRTKWDVRYRSGKFFSGLGDKLIHDDFEIIFDVAAKI